MKADSQVYLAIVNVGDSSDEGSMYSGPLTDVISKLIQHLGSTTVEEIRYCRCPRSGDSCESIVGRAAKESKVIRRND